MRLASGVSRVVNASPAPPCGGQRFTLCWQRLVCSMPATILLAPAAIWQGSALRSANCVSRAVTAPDRAPTPCAPSGRMPCSPAQGRQAVTRAAAPPVFQARCFALGPQGRLAAALPAAPSFFRAARFALRPHSAFYTWLAAECLMLQPRSAHMGAPLWPPSRPAPPARPCRCSRARACAFDRWSTRRLKIPPCPQGDSALLLPSGSRARVCMLPLKTAQLMPIQN